MLFDRRCRQDRHGPRLPVRPDVGKDVDVVVADRGGPRFVGVGVRCLQQSNLLSDADRAARRSSQRRRYAASGRCRSNANEPQDKVPCTNTAGGSIPAPGSVRPGWNLPVRRQTQAADGHRIGPAAYPVVKTTGMVLASLRDVR